MKNIFKPLILTITVIAFGTAVHAQESKYKTDVSIKEQIKKGTVPGQNFAPATTQLQQKQQKQDPNANVREKFSDRLKKGSLPGMRVAPGSSSTAFKANTTPTPKTNSNVALASSTAAKKQENAPAAKPVTLPTQEAPANKQ